MGVGELPDAVDDAVLVGDGEVGWVVVEAVWGWALEDEFFGGEGGVGVEHVDLLAVGAGGFEEGEAVGFVLGEGLLVAVDDLVGVVVEVAEGDEAAALADLVGVRGRCRSGSSRRGRARTLRRGCAPCASRGGTRRRGCRRCSDRSVAGLVFAEDDADEVVGAGFVVALLHGRGDLVVGLGDDVLHVDAGGVVTEGAEGVEAGHAVLLLQTS